MSEAMDKFKAYSASMETVKLEVPEIELTVYAEAMTLKQRRELLAKTANEDAFTSAITTVIMLALDEQGERMFTIEDKPKLLRFKGISNAIARLGGELMDAHSVADPLEPSKATET